MLLLLLMGSVSARNCVGIHKVNETAAPIWRDECVCVAGYMWNPEEEEC